MSGDLREQFESLAHDLVNDHRGIPYDVIRELDRIVALIPKDGVWVTEETLAAAVASLAPIWVDASVSGPYAAAILRHLREGTE